MEQTELAYCAGIFDGEGTVTLHPQSSKRKNITYYLKVQVVSVDRWLPFHFKNLFGGNVFRDKKYGNSRDAYRWVQTSKAASEFLKNVLPYLRLKRTHAEVGIEFQEHKTNGGRKSRDYLDFETDFKKLMLAMNKRGLK